MSGSSMKIRHIVIPITWVLTIIGAIGYLIYDVSIMVESEHKIGIILVDLLYTGFRLVGIVIAGYFLTVVWEVIADVVDNMSVISKSSEKLSDIFEKSSTAEKEKKVVSKQYTVDGMDQYDERLKALLLKRKSLIELFNSDELTIEKKAEIYKQLQEIDTEIKKRKQERPPE